MFDLFEADHFIAFDYSTAGEWKITDPHERSHRVELSGDRIEKVELEAYATRGRRSTT